MRKRSSPQQQQLESKVPSGAATTSGVQHHDNVDSFIDNNDHSIHLLSSSSSLNYDPSANFMNPSSPSPSPPAGGGGGEGNQEEADEIGESTVSILNSRSMNNKAISSTISNSNSNNTTNSNSNGKATILASVINLLNTVAGTGMLGLPYAFASAGFVTGSILLVLASFFSVMGLRLLAISAKTVHHGGGAHGLSSSSSSSSASFYSVATAAVPQFAIFIDAAVAIKGFGVATSYFITVGDCMAEAFKYILAASNNQYNVYNDGNINNNNIATAISNILINRQFWIVAALLLVLPISFFKTLSSLKFTSSLSLSLILMLAIVIVMYAEGVFQQCQLDDNDDDGGGGGSGVDVNNNKFTYDYYDYNYDYKNHNHKDDVDDNEDDAQNIQYNQGSSCKGDTHLITNFDTTLQNIAIFIFSFACHQNVFTIVNELKHSTHQPRVDIVLVMAIGLALILYLTVAIEGYRTYGTNVKSDILLNYPKTGLVTMMRMSIAIMVILSYPLQLDPSRRCLTSLITSNKRRSRREENNDYFHVNPPPDHEMEEEEIFYSLAENDIIPEEDIIYNNSMGDVVLESSNEAEIDEDTLSVVQNNSHRQTTDKDFIFYGITCSFLVFSFMVAMSVEDLGVVLGIVGATGSTIVSYILPGAVYVKLHPHAHAMKYFACFQLMIGAVMMPIALYFVIFKGGGG